MPIKRGARVNTADRGSKFGVRRPPPAAINRETSIARRVFAAGRVDREREREIATKYRARARNLWGEIRFSEIRERFWRCGSIGAERKENWGGKSLSCGGGVVDWKLGQVLLEFILFRVELT